MIIVLAAIADLARALVRPVVTFMLTIALIYFTFIRIVSGDVFGAIVGAVLAFWFASRQQEKRDKAEENN